MLIGALLLKLVFTFGVDVIPLFQQSKNKPKNLLT